MSETLRLEDSSSSLPTDGNNLMGSISTTSKETNSKTLDFPLQEEVALEIPWSTVQILFSTNHISCEKSSEVSRKCQSWWEGQRLPSQVDRVRAVSLVWCWGAGPRAGTNVSYLCPVFWETCNTQCKVMLGKLWFPWIFSQQILPDNILFSRYLFFTWCVKLCCHWHEWTMQPTNHYLQTQFWC